MSYNEENGAEVMHIEPTNSELSLMTTLAFKALKASNL